MALRKLKLNIKYCWQIASCMALLTLLVSACLRQETQPGPFTRAGYIDDIAFAALRWPDGETVLFIDDIKDEHTHGGSSTSGDPVFYQRGQAVAADGRSYQYRLEKQAGQRSNLTIDDQTYDLAQGTLFLITTREEPTLVQQYQRDLSTIPLTQHDIEAMAYADPVIAAFIRQNNQPAVAPPPASTHDCKWETVLPELVDVQPTPVQSGTEIKLMGFGGFLKDNCGGYNESARSFPLYLDHDLIGEVSCYVNRCQATVTIPPQTPPGTYCFSTVPAQCDVEVTVIN